MYKFNEDNVGYVLMEPKTKQLIAIDTGEFDKSSNIVKQLEKTHSTRLTHILSTHHHSDHIGGNLEWLRERPNDLSIIGSKRGLELIPGL